jgi:hypothetical protein
MFPDDGSHREFASGGVPLIRLAVQSFVDEVSHMHGEFEIITGLLPSDAESLLAKLR